MTDQSKEREIDLGGIAPLLQVFAIPTSLYFYRVIPGCRIIQSSEQGDDAD